MRFYAKKVVGGAARGEEVARAVEAGMVGAAWVAGGDEEARAAEAPEAAAAAADVVGQRVVSGGVKDSCAPASDGSVGDESVAVAKSSLGLAVSATAARVAVASAALRTAVLAAVDIAEGGGASRAGGAEGGGGDGDVEGALPDRVPGDAHQASSAGRSASAASTRGEGREGVAEAAHVVARRH